MRYTITGIFTNEGKSDKSYTLDYRKKSDVLEVIRENMSRDEFDTLIIRKHEDGQ